MTDPLQINDLINGKIDLGTIAEVAMVGTLADTTINRQGVQVDTIEGRLKKIGFAPPLAYAAGITFTGPLDAVKTVDNGGIIYGCLASARPFTTTGNFANDVASFFVVQDGNQAVGDVRTDTSNTYQAGTTQSFDTATANTFNLDGQDLQTKLNSMDQASAGNAQAISLNTDNIEYALSIPISEYKEEDEGGGQIIFDMPTVTENKRFYFDIVSVFETRTDSGSNVSAILNINGGGFYSSSSCLVTQESAPSNDDFQVIINDCFQTNSVSINIEVFDYDIPRGSTPNAKKTKAQVCIKGYVDLSAGDTKDIGINLGDGNSDFSVHSSFLTGSLINR